MRPTKSAFTKPFRFRSFFAKPLTFFVAVWLFSSCVPAESQKDSSASSYALTRYRTFKISGAVRTGATDPLFTDAGLEERVRLEVENELLARGLQTNLSNPDMLVYYYFGMATEDQLFPLPYRIGARSSYFMTQNHAANRLGSRFTIDLVDARANELIWSGSDSTYSMVRASSFKHIPVSIKTILRKFPS